MRQTQTQHAGLSPPRTLEGLGRRRERSKTHVLIPVFSKVCMCCLYANIFVCLHCFVGSDKYLCDIGYNNNPLWRSSGLFLQAAPTTRSMGGRLWRRSQGFCHYPTLKASLLGYFLCEIRTFLTKGCGTKMWSYPTSKKHIRTWMHGLSRQGKTLQFPPSVTTDLITWQEWKQWYPVCASLVVEKKTHRPQIVCTPSTTNQDDPCLLPIYIHFLFFCFYWVLLFTQASFFLLRHDIEVKLTAVCL